MKITVDTKQQENTSLRIPKAEPTREQLLMVFEAATILYEQAGKLRDQIELVKVSWWQFTKNYHLDTEFRVVFHEPTSKDKVSILIKVTEHGVTVDGEREPDLDSSFENAKELAQILTEALRRELSRQLEDHRNRGTALEAIMDTLPSTAASA